MIVKKLSISTLIIGIAGFIVSLYALILHIKHLMSPGGGALCDISASVSCSAVIGSRFGEFLSIPLGSYGMAYFAIMLSAALMPKFSLITLKQLAKLEFFIALIGLLIVIILIVISYSILKIICPTCSVIQALVVIYAFLKIFQLFRAYKKLKIDNSGNISSSHETYIRFFALALCLAIPPLMVGLLSPILVHYFGKNLPKVSSGSNVNMESSNTNTFHMTPSLLPKAMMNFNKSNYVGNGEDYRRGQDNASIIVQIFSDFGCPHCKTADDALTKAQNIVGLNKVLLVYRFFPLSNECNSFVGIKGAYGYNCALVVAARCAGQQGKFLEFKDWAFMGQDWTNQTRTKNFSLEGLTMESKNLKINTRSFVQCLESHTEDNKIKDDIVLANQLNIQGTPMIFINGIPYNGALDTNSFVKVFEHTLK